MVEGSENCDNKCIDVEQNGNPSNKGYNIIVKKGTQKNTYKLSTQHMIFEQLFYIINKNTQK